MDIRINHVILPAPPRIVSHTPPTIRWWLELSEDGRYMHVMCSQSDPRGGSTRRKIFTVYADGTGYLNKHKDAHIKGLNTDRDGRICLREIEKVLKAARTTF